MKKLNVVIVRKNQLFVQAMGSFQLFDIQNMLVKWRTKKVKELFVYLWHHRNQPIHRARIMEDLWPDLPSDRAATLMHTTVYQLRKTIKDMGIENPVTLINEQYTFNLNVASDLAELSALLQLTEITGANIEKIIELYPSNYLDEEDYAWAVSEQQKIRRIYLKYLERYLAMEAEEDRADYHVEICLEKMIQLDPYNEKYAYALLDHYGATRSTLKMIELFEIFKGKWVDELGIGIPKEIKELYQRYIIIEEA